MGLVGATLEFGMELDADEEVFFRKLDGFHQTAVRGQAGEHQACLGKHIPEGIGKFLTMAVTLADFPGTIAAGDHRVFF